MRNLVNGVIVCVAMLMILNLASLCHAQDMGKKIYRGVVNTLTGWVELPKNMYMASTEDTPLASITTGVVNGVKMFIVRTAVGVYETATFLFPIPKGYAPILKPELVFSKETA